MNYHEALGRYTELTEQLAAEKTRRKALLNNLGNMAGQATDRKPPTDYAALQALLDGAQQAETRMEEMHSALADAAAGCGKSITR